MAHFLGTQVHMVKDVHEELERIGKGLPALKALLDEWPPNPIRELSLELKATVAAAMKARQIPGQHPDEDRGETATVFYAAQQRGLGEVFSIVTDDVYGKQLARDKKFEVLSTPALTLDMVRSSALSSADGKRIWRHCVRQSRWKDFDAALAREGASR
jgi:hypothetical protein